MKTKKNLHALLGESETNLNEIEHPGEETAMILDSIIFSLNNNDSDTMFERRKEILLCINQKGFMFSASLADGGCYIN